MAADPILVPEDAVPLNVYLSGDTTAGGPVLPTVFNLPVTWGPGKVTLDGKPFDNPYAGPVPLWVVHTMTASGVRNDDGTVTVNGGEIYNHMPGAVGHIDYDDEEKNRCRLGQRLGCCSFCHQIVTSPSTICQKGTVYFYL